MSAQLSSKATFDRELPTNVYKRESTCINPENYLDGIRKKRFLI